ncbi:hypothetical protein GCM10023153_28540 [Ornithinibacter aureus]|uniref:Uncharacterized protein n=1 Tax=Ornithinibacter aureus TaxID=622664 RepID=A0ABP8K618_9MICO|nr:hypothetical protein [Ornithinibacter aureus]KAF0835474.1 hypothetical protein C8E84_3362 [Ornithinibacter aureus]
MDHFCSPSDVPAGAAGAVLGEVSNGRCPVYFQDAVNPGRWYVGYVVMIDEGIGAGLACWGQDFDQYFALINDPKFGAIYVDEFRKQWRVFTKVLDQTADERYGDGALAQFVDPDDINRKWFVASMFAADPDTAQFTEKAVAATVRSVELSLAIRADFRSPISPVTFARVFFRGAAAGAAEARRWTKHLDWLTILLEDS